MQVLLILAMIQRLKGTEFLFAAKMFLLQHVLRAIQIYKVYMKAQVPSKPAELALGFSFSYVQTSNVSRITTCINIKPIHATVKKLCLVLLSSHHFAYSSV